MVKPDTTFALNQIVEVRWQDASTRSAWGSVEEYSTHGVAECISVGYLLKHGSDKLLIVQTQADDEACNSAIAIPATWVRSIRLLTPKPSTKQKRNAKSRNSKRK